jgi:hypothetical protein
MQMRRRLSTLVLAALAAGFLTTPARAQFTIRAGTAQIQEDWKLVVAQGDTLKNGPQIMTYMSSVGDSSAPYTWFLLNVRDAPNAYASGGAMVQVWDYSDKLITSNTPATTAALNTTNETITWTQRMVIDPITRATTWDIISFVSTTWGSTSTSQVPVTYSGSTDFTTYAPNVSASKSRVGWMASNVTSMTLLTVRQYDNKGKLLATDSMNLSVNLTPQ